MLFTSENLCPILVAEARHKSHVFSLDWLDCWISESILRNRKCCREHAVPHVLPMWQRGRHCHAHPAAAFTGQRVALIWPTRIDTSHERLGCLGLTKSSMLSFFPLSFRGACQSKNIRSEIRAQRGTKHHGASKTCVKLILFHTRRQKKSNHMDSLETKTLET